LDVPKLFLPESEFTSNLRLVEGEYFGASEWDGAEMILGFDEARMMREEGLFRRIGDEFSDFF
jgi:hypothetical protein